MTTLIGQRLGRYEIVNAVGTGGMGEVYRARDTELGRHVAIKVISNKVSRNQRSIERFEREAKTVAQLSHPNILAIHDFGRENGIVFSVTEYLEGDDLRVRTRGSTLPVSKVLEIGIGVANGLAAAHNNGIIHRDIKPENVFVTSTGQVKILDFGIAGLRTGQTGGFADPDNRTKSLTGADGVVGTVGYMSPEQVRGEKVDSRSDIFALGCLLYELLTGQRAFQAGRPHETIRAILDQDPVPVGELRPDVAPMLEMIIGRCLEKRREERFESARDVAFALQALAGGRTAFRHASGENSPFGARRRRIAIAASVAVALLAAVAWMGLSILSRNPPLPEKLHLGVAPFLAPASDTSLSDFAAGLRLSLMDDLALVAQQEQGIDWIVPAAEADRGNALSTAGLGGNFGATLAIDGRLIRVGDRIRLTLGVQDPETGDRIREAVIEDVPSNLESFQHGPVQRVVEMLQVVITAETQQRIDASATPMAGVFDLFTRGRGSLALAQEPEQFAAAAELIDGAVAEDPIFAGAWVLRSLSRLALFESTGDEIWLRRGIEDATHALDLSGRPEAAWEAIAALHLAAGANDKAVEALLSGVHTAPNDPDLHLLIGDAYQRTGNLNEAKAHIQKAIYLRPDYWVGYDRLAWLHLSQGDLESAAIEFSHIISCAPGYALGYVKLAGVYMYLERPEAARPLLEKSLEIEPTPSALTNLGSIHFDASRFAEAGEYYRASLELESDDYVLWGNLGYAYRNGIEPEKAKQAFARAAELAEERRRAAPDDLELTATLASYYAMLGEQDRGLELLGPVAAAEPTNPMIIPLIAETYEDLGDRERALEWVSRSFDAGVSPVRFEGRPTLGKLIADKRYQALASKHTGAS